MINRSLLTRLATAVLASAVLVGCQVPAAPIAGPLNPVVSDWPESGQVAVGTKPALTDQELRAVVARLQLTGDPSQGRDLPTIDEPLAQLGMKLFFSKSLGGDQDAACVSCHHPLLGGGDGLSLSIGVGADDPDLLGPGRSHPSGELTVPRNAPTTFNIALWDQVLFFDGRVESLGKTPGKNGADGLGIRTPDSPHGQADPQAGANLVAAQSRFPITSEEEMRGFTFVANQSNAAVRSQLCERLAGLSWEEEFALAFGEQGEAETLITETNIAAALSAYQRSQVFVDTPWRAYVQGHSGAITPAAKRGALLFFRSREAGGADCASCHSGDFFTDEQFHVLALPQIGRGKDNGLYGDDDFGRFRETGRITDQYAFRTPTLLNVEVTAPYGHDGAYVNLEGIVRHHLDPAAAVASYDPAQVGSAAQTEHLAYNTSRALARLEQNRRLGLPVIEPAVLAEQQLDDLVAFLLTLTDPCVKDPACLAPWIPDADDTGPGGFQLQAKLLGRKN